MILEEAINKLLRDSVNLLLESPDFTIKAKQKNAPRPASDPYADVDLVSDTGIGWEQTVISDRTEDEDVDQTYQGMREIMMSIGFYREGSIDNARKVRTGLIREQVQELFRAADIGLIRRSEVREISESLEDDWEERAQFDVFLSAVGTDQEIVKSILSVDMAGAYQSRGLTYNFNIEVQ